MPLKTVRDVLVASSSVTNLVSTRISPVETQQGDAFPCVVLSIVSSQPQNHLGGSGNLDLVEVQLDAWSFTYQNALDIANACRSALDAAGILCISRSNDQFGLEKDPGAYRAGYIFNVWK